MPNFFTEVFFSYAFFGLVLVVIAVIVWAFICGILFQCWKFIEDSKSEDNFIAKKLMLNPFKYQHHYHKHKWCKTQEQADGENYNLECWDYTNEGSWLCDLFFHNVFQIGVTYIALALLTLFYPIGIIMAICGGVLYIARSTRRTCKKLTVHVEDLKAHKKCDCIKGVETCRECR